MIAKKIFFHAKLLFGIAKIGIGLGVKICETCMPFEQHKNQASE